MIVIEKKVSVEGEAEIELTVEDINEAIEQADPLGKISIINKALSSLTEEEIASVRAFFGETPSDLTDMKDRTIQLNKIECIDSIRKTWHRELARAERDAKAKP